MSADIQNLDPKALWKNFYKLTRIPRPSKKEGKIIQFIKEFGEELGLDTSVDAVGNVLIRKPATPGMENRKTVVLQGHLDMVPQKNSDKQFDFEKDPIEPLIDGEWVKANGTTLGSDNGIGVAAAMTVLESKDLQHGPIEALFTVDEETGMTGAFGLKPGWLRGDILINMDSEDEGELYVGCAGGTNANMELTCREEPVPEGHRALQLTISGLKGGHSGIDIYLYKGNANKLLNRFLWHATRKHGLRIASIDGGGLRNAIPREAVALVTVPAAEEAAVMEYVKQTEAVFRNEYATIDPDLKFKAQKAELPSSVIDAETQKNLVNAVYACPNDVIRMSNDMPGLVETSTNLARIKSEEGRIEVLCLLRSSVDSAREALKEQFVAVFEPAGAKIVFDGEYPGWKPNMDSPILKTMQEVYNSKFGRVPEIKAIHAGLECGLLGGVYPNLDMISFGPTIRYPHSPDEKVHIGSVKKFWDFLVETLKAIPKK
ncbi:MAG TPA: aminoacyl-histidine dipeptidase [Bacteroidetes bacterium]|nr:aminoacyl-histidine dipeptidase [Bacteroidota bacterium]